EERLTAAGHAVAAGKGGYPVPLPYVIAETEKGYGFPGAGTGRAHNLPLCGNPHDDPAALAELNAGIRALWVPRVELVLAAQTLCNHAEQHRRREGAHPMASRDPADVAMTPPPWRYHDDPAASAMAGIDATFEQILERNPSLRPRVGNPDEMESNCMHRTLARLRHRVCEAEPGAPEAVDGAVITALNEEAVVCAALGNKAGINLVVSYEAFAVKMLGALRQEIIFARHQREAGYDPRWHSVPVISTSHLWENGKNEQSHQDPTLCEALMQEMADSARVVFPADWNSAVEALRHAYRQRGRIWNLVVPKRAMPHVFLGEEACRLATAGALHVCGDRDARVQLVAVGAYQLEEARRAAEVLDRAGVPTLVTYVMEPGRFRIPRDATEAQFVAGAAEREVLFPADTGARVVLVHGHPEAFAGVLRGIDLGPARTTFLGYQNRGGTLDTPGMLQANGCTWKHAVRAAAKILGTDAELWLRDVTERPSPRARPRPKLTAL
ncbi:MAG TPA: xylulose 5-phosphate 3-epimerase, partial [Myxococcota bacterium]|nr:xylulose 5-phosphate 3-epimerase [Myxococcota bacterium]